MKHKFKAVAMIAMAILSASLFGGVYVKFDPQGGTFAVAGVTMEVGSIPDQVVMEKGYADPVRIGYYFAGWSSIAHPKDEAELDAGFAAYYATPVTKATTFYAIWEQYEPFHDDNGIWNLVENGFDVVGTNGYTTSGGYDVPGRGWVSFKWRVVQVDDGLPVVAYGFNRDTALGLSEFDIRLAAERNEERQLSLGRASGEWSTARIPMVQGGVLQWIIEGEVAGECCGLGLGIFFEETPLTRVEVRDITWESAANFETKIFLEPCGGALPVDNVILRNGQYGELPEPIRDGCWFLGWSRNRYWYDYVGEDDWLPLDGDVTLYAVWDVPPELVLDPKGTIIDDDAGSWLELYCDCSVCPKWTWGLDDKENVYDGEILCWNYDANPWWMYLGYDYFENWMEYEYQYGDPQMRYKWWKENAILSVYVRGCGILRIKDMHSDHGNNLVVVVDGVKQELLGDQSGGYYIDVRKRAGINSFGDSEFPAEDWDYDLHEIMIAVEDLRACCGGTWYFGELGAMEWIAVSDPVEVVFDACGGKLCETQTGTYVPGGKYGSLPLAERDKFEFVGWYTDPNGGVCVTAGDYVWLSCRTLYARWRSDDLSNTIGGGKLRLATKGECGWEATSAVCHDSDYCTAATTSIMWGETNRLTTVVQGPGILNFWWMQGEDVSDFYDASLYVEVDGRRLECAEHSKWCSMSVPILGRGNHTVVWCYTPGAYIKKYSDIGDEWTEEQWSSSPREAWDCEKSYLPPGALPPGAWIDGVEWVQAGNVKDIVTWARGVVQGRAWLMDVLPIVEAEYAAKIAEEPLNYEWRVLRAITKLCRLGENENLKAVMSRFGLTPDYQVLGHFFGELDYFDAPLSNEVVDELAAEAVPVLESALADLEAIPDDWTGSIPLDPATYPVDVVTHVDLADVTLCKAILKGVLSALAIAESYDLSVDYMNAEMEEILAEAGLKPTLEYVVIDHPEFAKRVRDAERLGEGKEILRDALETLQDFDRLMQARSTAEMHFFEYDAADADEQQYARDEVAKLLVSLDGEVVVNNDDFRYDGDFRIENLRQPVTLVPFFAGELTRRYLPTVINGNVPVFDSFPSMAFGGAFPGLTKDIVADWLAAYDCEVEYTPNSDYEPEMKFRTFNSAIPNLGLSATPEEINDALAGTVDAKVKANIADATSYAAYETWATKVRSSGVPLKTVKASPCSWQSFALATPELMQGEITDDDLKVEEFKPSSEAGKFDFTVSVKGVTVGSEAVGENLEQVIGLEGATSLGEGFRPENVAVKFAQPEDGKLKFTAEPKDKSVKSFFMRMKVR